MVTGKQPVIEIITVGSELISWIKEERNSRYITDRLDKAGFSVRFRTVVGDIPGPMIEAFRRALSRSRIIFITGGLGPTMDDITREVLGKLLGKNVQVHRQSLEKIKRKYQKRGLTWTPGAGRQAMILQGAEVLENRVGHAPGMMITQRNKNLILLPGVPAEMKHIYDKWVHDRLIQRYHPVPPERKILKVTGLPEAQVNDMIAPLIPPGSGIKILFTVGSGELLLRLEEDRPSPAGRGELKPVFSRIRKVLGDRVFSMREESLEQTVARMLRKKELTIATAESCTGGLLAHRLTGMAGSSDYFLEGAVTYTNESKIARLGLKRALLAGEGAVSPKVAEAMAAGIASRAGSSQGVGITGIAGPGGGTKERPVGLVYVALADRDGASAHKFLFSGARSEIQFRTTQAALDLVRLYMLKGSLHG